MHFLFIALDSFIQSPEYENFLSSSAASVLGRAMADRTIRVLWSWLRFRTVGVVDGNISKTST